MSERMVAYCGIVCTDCDAYIATQAEDMEALQEMAAKASGQLGIEMTAADGMCDGCKATTGRQIGYCHDCGVRSCAVQKHVETCAHCTDYPCDVVEGFSTPGTPHRATLDQIYADLQSAG